MSERRVGAGQTVLIRTVSVVASSISLLPRRLYAVLLTRQNLDIYG